MEKERFSLLLLEPHEIYFEDYSVELQRPKEESVAGRLKVCSKSVVFEPKSVKNPLIKLQFAHFSSIEEADNNSLIIR